MALGIKTYNTRVTVVILHILLWICYGQFLYFILVNRLPPGKIYELPQHIILFLLPQIALVYTNMEILVPKFFIDKKYWQYTFIVLLMLVAVYFIMDQIAAFFWEGFEPPKGRFYKGENRMIGPPFPRGGPGFKARFNPSSGIASLNFILTLAIFFLSTAIKISQIVLIREKESAQLRSENLDTELKLLRSQINPHFLFNTLNNIYNLSLQQSPRTSDFIVKLSEILRYIIYDCNIRKVSLQKEIDYIGNYIELQKLKDDSISKIVFQVEGDTESLLIEPMLLIPFVENSFKHSKIESNLEGWINISIELKDHELEFRIENSIPGGNHNKDNNPGVGIENVKRRLNLLYPDLHQLHIHETQDSFKVLLNILL